MHRLVYLLLILTTLSGRTHAGDLEDLLPAGARHCTVQAPPDTSGLAVTPGGFVMVFPRNAEIPASYTGCKALWIADGERTPRLATLYFKNGKLAIGVAHDLRDPRAGIDGACAFPAGKSLRPNQGRKLKDSGCHGMTDEPMYGLHVPTWPRICMKDADNAVCRREPE